MITRQKYRNFKLGCKNLKPRRSLNQHLHCRGCKQPTLKSVLLTYSKTKAGVLDCNRKVKCRLELKLTECGDG